MPMTRDQLLKLRAAKQQAKAAGMFVVERSGAYLLIREARPKNVVVGERGSIDGLAQLVAAAARTAPAAGARA